MCSHAYECDIQDISYDLMASHNEEYEYVKELKVLHISVYYLRSCTPFCSCTQNLSSPWHCTSSRGSKYNQYVAVDDPITGPKHPIYRTLRTV